MQAHARRVPQFDLFAPLAPYASGYLDVDTPHRLYWEQSGNPDGAPILLIHGGPGEGTLPVHRRFFDPDHYRIIAFDQRGAGRSQPLGCLERNSLPLLINDIERLREHLRIERWHLFGGSWGSTLALAYAQKHPQRCSAMILRGIFLMEQEEIDWFFFGIRQIFPEAWEQFANFAPADRQDDLLAYYYAALTGEDREKAYEAGLRWCLYEGACASLIPNYETITSDTQKETAWSMARIEAHYFTREIIPRARSLIGEIDIIRAIPAIIIQGRYDILCPMRSANRLHQAWPEADYVIVPDGGHAALDPAIRTRLIEATENAKTIR